MPKEEGTEAARAAEEEAHRAATAAARRLASREWAEARTPRNPPTRNLNMLDLVSSRSGSADVRDPRFWQSAGHPIALQYFRG